MRKIQRGDDLPPEGLSAKDKKKKTELQRAITHFAPRGRAKKRNGPFNFKAYKSADVKLRLESLFHGKCAYCESFYSSTAPVDIEHYRPKGAIEGEKLQLGYWWLAMAWDNLLPSCIDCNRKRKQATPTPSSKLLELLESSRSKNNLRIMNTGKKDTFPIEGTRATNYKNPEQLVLEKALLIDPTRDDPAEDLEFFVDRDQLISLVLPRPSKNQTASPAALPVAGAGIKAGDVATDATGRKFSVRGAVSIQVYGLNRLGLVQNRTRILRQLEFLSGLVIELHNLADEVRSKGDRSIARRLVQLAGRIIAEMKRMAEPDAPYSAVADAWLKRFKADLAPRKG